MSGPVILPPDALAGVRLGLSVSESPDLARLGLLEGHFRLALGEIARTVLVLGGGLAYGGHLDAAGYTAFLLSELKRYGRRDRPLAVLLAWPEHRRVSLGHLRWWERELGLFGSVTYLDVAGAPTDPALDRTEDPVPVTDPAMVSHALTAMRVASRQSTQGRILLGGRRSGFQGSMPGLVEEALIAIEAGQPLYLAGGFGGVTLELVRCTRPDAAAWAPAYAGAPAADPLCANALARVESLVGERGWAVLGNGLDDEENSRLAATHRPSEIATLVSVGLGRLASQGSFTRR
jgi:hypothetical protein